MGNSRFSDGVMLGALLGGAAVFLLGTKKGNKILKVLTEEGISGISTFLEDFESSHESEKPVPEVQKEVIKTEIVETSKGGVSQSVEPPKRFFKKSK